MRRICMACVLMIIALSLQAQNYVPFPTTAIWTQRHGNGDTTPSFYYYGLANQDTLLDAYNYHKLFRSDDTLFQPSECVGGLREDSLRRIYFYDLSTGQERMLYNFSVQPGDTVDYDPGSAGIVDHIDSVNIGNDYRRRINFRTYGGNAWIYGAWIDGIGNASVGGLLGSGMLQPTCDCAGTTICFMQANEWLYHNPAFQNVDCMQNLLSVREKVAKETVVAVYPNPLYGRGIVRISGPAIKGSLRIYNAAGMLLRQYVVSGPGDISISNYPAGMYFYNFEGNSGKFMVE